MDRYDHSQQQGSYYDSGWRLIRSYWKKKQYFPLYLSFSIVVGMTTTLVALDFIFNYWYYTYFYNGLQGYDKHGAAGFFSFFAILSVCYAVLGLHRYLTSQLIERQWLNKAAITRLILKYRRLDPKSRLVNLINVSLDFSMKLVIVITTFSAFMYYCCLLIDELAEQFQLPDITNYFIVASFIFAIFSTIFLIKKRYPHCQLVQAETWQKNLPLWLLAGHSVIYVIFSLLLILPSYIEKLYLLIAVIYSLQIFLRSQRLFVLVWKERLPDYDGTDPAYYSARR
jgi:ABC-type uncharacterized transport system fused permease/ATPase subunit